MMKKYLLFSLLFSTSLLFAQDITGHWNGVLKVGAMQLRLVFHVSKTETGYSSTMDSPDQGVKGIPTTKTEFANNLLKVEIAAMKIEYSGKLDSGFVKGNFKQGGMSLALNLNRKATEKVETKRPQNPIKPYPYYSEEVTFDNANDNFKLAGTLTLPKKEGKFPVVVLISGSGPQNRDEELMGHKPFLVLSDYLTRNGIGVLRFDDRGCYESKGNFATATTNDFATDVESAVNYLKTRSEIDQKHIGLIGHSEGGIIAPIVAVTDKNIDFIVLMAGTGVSGSELLLKQQDAIGQASGMKNKDLKTTAELNTQVYKMVNDIKNSDTLKMKISNYLTAKSTEISDLKIPEGKTSKDMIDLQLAQLTTPWMLNFIRYNPSIILEKVTCPVLAINGDKDLQVDSNINLPAIEKVLKKGGNKQVITRELPGLNHLFQECKTGLPAEYVEIEQTISPAAMETISKWINSTIK